MSPWNVVLCLSRAVGPLLLVAGVALAAGPGSEVEVLQEQNRRLQAQLQAQQATIEALNAKFAALQEASERHERELRELQEQESAAALPPAARHRGGDVRVGAEAGLAFFHTGREGQFPKGEFRADDPVITLEAPVRRDVYLFAELKLLPRETNEEDFELGEIYVDFEDVSDAWGQPGLLNVRVGRLNIPFGEEYQHRGPIANPLISHSLSDIWGVDEGIGAYGRVGPARYVVAVQNGGVSRLRDYHADKSVAGRVGWDPAAWLSVSASAMTTGRLAAEDDQLSELWFGNGFFRAIGPLERTSTFSARLFEFDAIARWEEGHVSVALGRADYADSDPLVDQSRRIRYGMVELVQNLAGRLYGAARISAIRAPGGYPLAGWGSLGRFFFRPGVLTEELQRLSLGLGYQFGPPLVLKVEYSRESGRMTDGAGRDHQDFIGSQLGVKF